MENVIKTNANVEAKDPATVRIFPSNDKIAVRVSSEAISAARKSGADMKDAITKVALDAMDVQADLLPVTGEFEMMNEEENPVLRMFSYITQREYHITLGDIAKLVSGHTVRLNPFDASKDTWHSMMWCGQAAS